MLRVASLATNMVVMLFVQSLTYNLTNPDDGSCNGLDTYSACTQPESSLNPGHPKCQWSSNVDGGSGEAGTGSCSFIDVESSLRTVLFIAVLSAVVSTPVALALDWLMGHVLAAPTALPVSKVAAVINDMDMNDNSRNHSLRLTTSPAHSALDFHLHHMGGEGAFSAAVIRASLLSSCKLEFSRLGSELRAYRELLPAAHRPDFDETWGLDPASGEFSATIQGGVCRFILSKISKTDASNVGQTILQELVKIRESVAEETKSFQLKKSSDRDKGRRLLFLFQCDLLPGITGKILEAKGNRDFSKVHEVSWEYKAAGWALVALVNAGFLFYIFLFAVTQTKARSQLRPNHRR